MKKKIAFALAAVVVIAAVAGLWCWFDSTCLIVNGTIVRRDASQVTLSGEDLPDQDRLAQLPNLKILDVRQIELTTQDYEQLRSRFPEVRILWNVPFQGGYVTDDETELTITNLTMEDLEKIAYMPKLQRVNALGCRDYEALTALKAARPELEVLYTVTIGTNEVRENTSELRVDDSVLQDLAAALPYLPELKTLDAIGCRDYEALTALKAARPELEVRYTVTLSGQDYRENTTSLALENADAQELIGLLPYLPELAEVSFLGNVPENEEIYQMMQLRPDVTFQWNFTMFEKEVSSTTTLLDLSGIPMESTEEVEGYLKYFQNLERVEMCDCGIPSLEMDALAQRHPEIRFVWTIRIRQGSLRTDAVAFIPYKLGYDIDDPLYDEDCRELKYCVDLVCLDMGHMRITDYSFLESMPKLKYLILGDTPGTDFSPLAGLTELIYLEIFNTKFSQTELLLNMTKLEDLNIGYTPTPDVEVLKQMTWLKRLWLPGTMLSSQKYLELKEALPDTQVVMYVAHPTEGNWRDNDNYRDMRDLLGMYYME